MQGTSGRPLPPFVTVASVHFPFVSSLLTASVPRGVTCPKLGFELSRFATVLNVVPRSTKPLASISRAISAAFIPVDPAGAQGLPVSSFLSSTTMWDDHNTER